MSMRTSLDPHDPASNTPSISSKNALLHFHEVAQRVKAYRHFLEKNGVDPASIVTEDDFKRVPPTSKSNYFSQYSPDELSWDNTMNRSHFISTSSGSSGKPFFWPRGDIHGETVGEMFRYLFEDIIGSKEGSTLCIISMAFGQWIAGFEFYNAINRTRSNGSVITIITSSLEVSDVLNKARDLSHMYDRVVITGYPPFIKDILELGLKSGIAWEKQDVHLITAGEPFSEHWRDYVLGLIGKGKRIYDITNVYGMSEVGVVGHETPISILLRRYFADSPVLSKENITSLYQYYPSVRYLEVEGASDLLLTANADFPLVRYETRDMGGIATLADIVSDRKDELAQQAEYHGVDLALWQLPFVYLLGRRDFSVTLYGLNIYTENVKMSLDDAGFASQLSGLFIMEVIEKDEQLNQQLRITIELDRDIPVSETLRDAIRRAITTGLRRYNSEYAKLHASLGTTVEPHIILVPYGDLETIRGKKHKWVKRK